MSHRNRDPGRDDACDTTRVRGSGSHQQVPTVTASPILRRDSLAPQRGVAKPILMMALLALTVFGAIGSYYSPDAELPGPLCGASPRGASPPRCGQGAHRLRRESLISTSTS